MSIYFFSRSFAARIPGYLCIFSLAIALATGCSSSNTPGDDHDHDDAGDADDHDDGEGHAHGSVGPHGGALVEMGGETYHVELLKPTADSEQVTVYILDSAAKENVAIAASKLMLNLSVHGTPAQFELSPQPLDGEAEGESSRFQSNDDALLKTIAHAHVDVTVVFEAAGTSYRGTLPHAH